MPRSSVSKLVPKVPGVPGVPGATLRQQYSASTKRGLVDVAEELFTEHGYAATSLDAIVSGARVTKGALYHHFSGKQALFEAVFERVEAEASRAAGRAYFGLVGPFYGFFALGLALLVATLTATVLAAATRSRSSAKPNAGTSSPPSASTRPS